MINLLLIKNDSIPDATELVTAYNFKFSSAFLLILSSAMIKVVKIGILGKIVGGRWDRGS